MTTTDPSDPSDPPVHQPPYPLPPGITAAGRREFDEVMREHAAHLINHMALAAHQGHRMDRECTARDVREAQQAYERSIREHADVRDADRRVLAALLLTVGTVGVSVMSNFLHSEWQIAIFVLLALTGVVGLVLTWSSRPQPG